MRIIDARSGRDNLKPGDVVSYPDGEWWELVSVEDRLFSASVMVRDHDTGGGGEAKRVPLAVRFLHPMFFLQRIGFFPS